MQTTDINTNTHTDSNSTTRHDVLRFSAWYCAALGLLLAVGLVGVQPGAGLSLAAVIAAAVLTVNGFMVRERRAPSAVERRRLVTGSFVASVLISIVATAGAIALTGGLGAFAAVAQALSGIDPGLGMAVAAVVLLVQLLALWLVYRWFPALRRRGRPSPSAD
ncbi:MAG: ABZJ_00895 family protein [Gammaproteobacteria bacterium]|nr:ABZJ_00895 family protein [Gammaproteobacteria bacterium]